MQYFSRLVVLIGSVMMLALLGCQDPTVEELTQDAQVLSLGDPELHGWVHSHSTGDLDPSGAVSVRLGDQALAHLQSQSSQKSQSTSTHIQGNQSVALEACPILISPQLETECYWQGDQILLRAPQGFASGTQYQLAMDLNYFPGIQGDFIKWSQVVPPRDFQVNLSELISDSLGESYILPGVFISSHRLKLKDIQTQLQTTGSTSAKVHWVNEDSVGTHFAFEIRDIQPQTQASQLELKVSKDDYDRPQDWTFQVEVPAKESFQLISSRWIDEAKPYALLSFSQPLHPTQKLRGLVTGRTVHEIIRSGSQLKVYGNFQSQSINLTISRDLKSLGDKRISKNVSVEVKKLASKPQLKILGDGNILPSRSTQAKVYFEATGLKEVSVKVRQVSPDRITQHLQVNSLAGVQQLKRTGELVYQRKVSLSQLDASSDRTYALGIDSLLLKYKGSLLQFEISFNPKQIQYECEDRSFIEDYEEPELDTDVEPSYWDYSGYGSWWQNNLNPCHPAYYHNRSKVYKNIVASDLSIIAKSANSKKIWVSVRDILTGEAISGAQVIARNFQGRILQELSAQSGVVEFDLDQEAFIIEAVHGEDRNYLKLRNKQMLSISNFDIQGSSASEGIQVYQYGDRGVWRPGDTLHLSAIAYDPQGALPSQLGVKMELRNPHNNVIQRATIVESLNGFYHWKVSTPPEALTGNYTWTLKFAGKKFKKNLKIATVKPNRLKVSLKFMDGEHENLKEVHSHQKLELYSRYLHGAKASGLSARLYLKTRATLTQIPKAQGYQFDDLVRKHRGDKTLFWSGKLDGEGMARVPMALPQIQQAPGQLHARFEAEVQESGGQSVRYESRKMNPYKTYIGIKTPPGDAARNMLLTDEDHEIQVIARTPQGDAIQASQVEMKLYKLGWKWWWMKQDENSVNFLNASSTRLLQEKVISVQGDSKWKIRINKPEWGRYLIRACDLQGGHCTSKIVFIDWPGWAGRAQEGEVEGPQILAFATDKKSYQIGDELRADIPSAGDGYLWVSLENGTQVLQSFWQKVQAGSNQVRMKIPPHSSPNAYLSVVLVQPSQGRDNDLPLRLYGVVPIEIQDPSTRLSPVLHHDSVLKPHSRVQVRVSEAQGQAMTYTLAMVDEGLLDLTNFKTPDPHQEFYKKQTLGIRTYDLYDDIMGVYQGNLDQLLAIGGGGSNRAKKSVKRFQSMVKFIGPYHIKAGDTASHELEMGSYVGSVRLMLVAGDPRQGTFGQVESTVPVRQDVMVQGTLPRVLGPLEKVQFALQVFNMSSQKKKVNWKVGLAPELQFLGRSKGQVQLGPQSDTIIMVPLQVRELIAATQVSFEASSGSDVSRDKIDIQIRPPLPLQREVESVIIPAGVEQVLQGQLGGYPDHREIQLSLSQGHPLHIEDRLQYLMGYPHGCVEQTTSKAFPQLYLDRLITLDHDEKQRVIQNVEAAILRLQQFQNPQGLLSYWPGQTTGSDWGSIYAAHFLTEAKSLGYVIDNQFYQRLIKALRRNANRWRQSVDASLRMSSSRIQAYRLYVLALAKQAPVSALNRLNESGQLKGDLAWYLAAAYYLKGNKQQAVKMIQEAEINIAQIGGESHYTYGSTMRNQAMLLDLASLMGQQEIAFRLGDQLSRQISQGRLYSTQESAWALKSLAHWQEKFVSNQSMRYSIDKQDMDIQKSISKHDVKLGAKGQYQTKIKNLSETPLYVQVIKQYHPDFLSEKAQHQGIEITEKYLDLQGQKLQPKSLKSGSDIILKLKVSNKTNQQIQDIALTQSIPSGWEFLMNAALPPRVEYQDIRDAQAHYYFDLAAGQSINIEIPLKVSYQGEFYLPGAQAEAMYQLNIQSRLKGRWVQVRP